MMPCDVTVSSSFMTLNGFTGGKSHLLSLMATCSSFNVPSELVAVTISSSVIALGTLLLVIKLMYSSVIRSCLI